MVYLTRRAEFSASHYYHNPEMTPEENRRTFGKCNNPHGHGHDYVLEVSVAGPVEPRTGRAVDLAALDALVNGEVVRAFDRKDLNSEAPEFARAVPTTENLAAAIRSRLGARWREAFPGAWPKLDGIRIQETKRNRFELR